MGLAWHFHHSNRRMELQQEKIEQMSKVITLTYKWLRRLKAFIKDLCTCFVGLNKRKRDQKITTHSFRLEINEYLPADLVQKTNYRK